MRRYEMEHYDKIRGAAPECMVLLKSDGSFPLQETGKLALYGNGARHTLKGGTGSGDVYVRSFKSIEEALEAEGFTLTTGDWLDGYDQAREKAHTAFLTRCRERIEKEGPLAILDIMGEVMPEPEYDLPLEAEGQVAIYVLSRICGEGSDRKDIKGDFRLTDSEIRDILALSRTFQKFILVLNTGGVVDLGPVVNAVPNILLLSMPGMAVGEAFADVLMGRQSPSGKLTATWNSDYDFVRDFGCKDDTRYYEGLYSGYRGFELFEKEALFPFGYGRSYTTFDTKVEEVSLEASQLTVKASVTNTGSFAGKEVVQVYVSVPQGKLDHPLRELAGFGKTKLLQPGESEQVSVQADLALLASYDETRQVRFLEQGEYLVFAGCSLKEAKPVALVSALEEQILEQVKSLERKPDFADPEVLIPEGWQTVIANCEKNANLPKLTLSMLNEARHLTTEPEPDLAEKLTNEQLAHVCVGGYLGEGNKSVLGNAGFTVAGAAGQTTSLYGDLGIPSLVMADGPAGLRISKIYGLDEKGIYNVDQGTNDDMLAILPESIKKALGMDKPAEQRSGKHYTQYCSAIPVGTAIAQSFNVQLAKEMGDLVGAEMERFGVHLWLAPALNIQRHPLCGRNFEYYSEDPYLTGEMASAMVEGIQSMHIAASVKHFALNNKETNRNESDSRASERAIREIYLKAFEIVVKKAKPWTIMSSYNAINGIRASESKELLTDILRNEWGFDGLVTTDWWGHGEQYKETIAGGDIKMGLGFPDRMKEALRKDLVTEDEIRVCARRVLELILKFD